MPLIRKGVAAAPAPGPADGQRAVAALRSGTVEERWSAARALGAFPGGAEALGDALLVEADPRVREAIFTSLARLRSPASVDAVMPHLRSDDASLRTGALDALRAMIGAVRPRLPLLLEDPDPDVRILTCDLVRELPSAEATALLCDVLARERVSNVCAAAVEVLADIGEASALPSLDACSTRFRGEAFLTFAIAVAVQRILSQQPGRHG
ncbi:MAG: HEAT repeat domain-containing protein [Acetobacteraceae bacterium]